jgi:hypothetical protein
MMPVGYSEIALKTLLVGLPALYVQILNPAETFGDIIVDYSYVECTSACITALTAFDRLYPGSR